MIDVTTIQEPEGTGASFDIERSSLVYRNSLGLSAPMLHLGPQTELSIGGSYHRDQHEFYTRLWSSEANIEYASNSYTLGLLIAKPQ